MLCWIFLLLDSDICYDYYLWTNFIFSNGYERPLTSKEHISGVKQFANKVNIVRASIAYIVSKSMILTLNKYCGI